MKKLFVLLCSFVLALALIGFSWAGEDDVIKAIVDARAAIKQFPNPSAQIPDLSVEKAYALQKKLTKALLDKGQAVGGYKAGLTSEGGQKKFGVPAPLFGPLFKAGELGPDAAVNSKDFVRLFVENEVCYVIGHKISEPVKDVESLKKMVKEVFPAVELPDLRFADMKNLKGTDIIADAVGAAKYIIGKRMPADKVDVNKVEVTMTLDGKEANKGKATDALGDQWKALLWLVNGVVAQGYPIEPGQIFITGAMGNMIPGKRASTGQLRALARVLHRQVGLFCILVSGHTPSFYLGRIGEFPPPFLPAKGAVLRSLPLAEGKGEEAHLKLHGVRFNPGCVSLLTPTDSFMDRVRRSRQGSCGNSSASGLFIDSRRLRGRSTRKGPWRSRPRAVTTCWRYVLS